MVPTQETRQGVRKVCKVVKETEMRTVTCDEGHWETQMVEVPCAPARAGLLSRCRSSAAAEVVAPAAADVLTAVTVAAVVTAAVAVQPTVAARP